MNVGVGIGIMKAVNALLIGCHLFLQIGLFLFDSLKLKYTCVFTKLLKSDYSQKQ